MPTRCECDCTPGAASCVALQVKRASAYCNVAACGDNDGAAIDCCLVPGEPDIGPLLQPQGIVHLHSPSAPGHGAPGGHQPRARQRVQSGTGGNEQAACPTCRRVERTRHVAPWVKSHAPTGLDDPPRPLPLGEGAKGRVGDAKGPKHIEGRIFHQESPSTRSGGIEDFQVARCFHCERGLIEDGKATTG